MKVVLEGGTKRGIMLRGLRMSESFSEPALEELRKGVYLREGE